MHGELPIAEKDFVRWVLAMTIVPIVYAIGVVAQRWHEPHLGRTIVLVVIGVLPLVFADVCHERFPSMARIPPVLWSVPALVAVTLLILTPVDNDLAPFLLFLVTVHAATAARFADGVAVALLSIAVMVSVDIAGRFHGSFIWVLGITLAWLAGFGFRRLLQILGDLRAAQTGLAERAAADERARIAREIHDVVAHSLSVAALHITGARMALKRSPEEAAHALEDAERLARDSLAQVRAAIGVLAPAADGTAPAQPTAEDIPRLVQEFVAAGAAVALDVDGDLHTVSPAIGLTLYRITQESLSNVIRHASDHTAAVRIACTAQGIDLVVTNATNGAEPGPPGRGIIGMQQRAGAHGGSLVAERVHDVWRVHLTIPAA